MILTSHNGNNEPFAPISDGHHKGVVVDVSMTDDKMLEIKFQLALPGLSIMVREEPKTIYYLRQISLLLQPNLAGPNTQRYIKAILGRNWESGVSVFELDTNALLGLACELLISNEEIVNIRAWNPEWDE